MTLCLPPNLFFDKAIPGPPGFFHLYKDIQCSNRMHGMWCCTRFLQTASAQVGWWEPPIFIHDKETALVCWHRLLHLHAVIDCLPLPGHSVHHQIDELVSFVLSPCHLAVVQRQCFKLYIVLDLIEILLWETFNILIVYMSNQLTVIGWYHVNSLTNTSE